MLHDVPTLSILYTVLLIVYNVNKLKCNVKYSNVLPTHFLIYIIFFDYKMYNIKLPTGFST